MVLVSEMSFCGWESWTYWGDMIEYAITHCLKEIGIFSSYTRDVYGRERFVSAAPWVVNGLDSSLAKLYVQKQASLAFNRETGPECCSEDVVSFSSCGKEFLKQIAANEADIDRDEDRELWVVRKKQSTLSA